LEKEEDLKSPHEKQPTTRIPSTLCAAIFHLLNWKKSLAKMKDPMFKKCKMVG